MHFTGRSYKIIHKRARRSNDCTSSSNYSTLTESAAKHRNYYTLKTASLQCLVLLFLLGVFSVDFVQSLSDPIRYDTRQSLSQPSFTRSVCFLALAQVYLCVLHTPPVKTIFTATPRSQLPFRSGFRRTAVRLSCLFCSGAGPGHYITLACFDIENLLAFVALSASGRREFFK